VLRLSNELDRQHRLVTAEALYQAGGQRLSRYRFRHYLFQHYLYHRLDVTERAYLHEAVGSVLEGLYGEHSEQIAVQLAYHYEQAGVTEKAVTYLLQAGERAQRLSANQEAIRHLSQGLMLLANLPDSPPRARLELALQISLGHALAAINGYAAPEVGKAYNRAYELALQVEEAPQIFAALHGLQAYHNSLAELHKTRAVAEQMLRLTQSPPDPFLRVAAHHVLGSTYWNLAELGPAREQFEQGIALYHRQNHQAYVRLCGQDEGVACLALLAYLLWLLGYPDQALQRAHEALALAEELAHPFTHAMALNYVTLVHLFRREEQEFQRQAEAFIKLSTDQDFSVWLANATFVRGYGLVRQGKMEGIKQMQRGLSARLATGSEVHQSTMLVGLAEGYMKAGETEQGLRLLSEALALVNKGDSRILEAEIYRLKGELLLIYENAITNASSTRFAEAEASFHQAIDVARRQQAKSFELRATINLCRLWQVQGKGAEAHALLAEIYGWFTEGFDSADLLEAKALLEALP
jgi:predicted ATPase